jgi:transposase
LVKSEIGDIGRFAKSNQLISYVGLSPRVFQSGERCYYGGLGKWGNRWLRYGLGLLAQRIAGSRKDNSLRRTYWRLSFRKHRNTAKIAVARKATRIIHQMLTNRETWDDSKAMMRTKAAA